ncbi:DUF4231 domain-containing protein [Pseudoalteromonas rubra]|uniref:DUF4231 domain-containing protein n=1 Tax=Pseudoalteromonas rubra TaxID=43658 RepID=UPI000F7879F0|nr:DUF4231 domain-containing protein [Pseudoalteromonas rubra]
MTEEFDEVKELSRIADSKIKWLNQRANTCMCLFWLFSVVLGVSSTSLPLFALTGSGNEENWVVASLSVIVAFSTFMLQVGNYHLLWQNYRRAEFEVKRLKENCLYMIRSAKDEEESARSIREFYKIYEQIEVSETSTYFSSIKSANDVKG